MQVRTTWRVGIQVLAGGLGLGLLAGGILLWLARPAASAPGAAHAPVTTRPPPAAQAPARSVTDTAAANSVPAAPTADPRAATAEPRGALAAENGRLRRMNAQLQTQLTDLLNWILRNFRGRYPLSEEHLERLALRPVTPAFTLHPEVADFLRVTPEEEALLNDALAYVHWAVNEIESAGREIERPAADKSIIRHPPFPEAGLALREDLYHAFEMALGPERLDRFLLVAEENLTAEFSYFGQGQRTVIFQTVFAPDTGQPYLRIKDGWILRDAENRTTVQAVESDHENLPRDYADYRPYLPPGWETTPLE
ncbi:MAG: hypothetical protein K9N49_01140 [Candidatus Marinimicrobia bacterium]|nr:hypothetical protein [Candidatus Neomarinimicrobiota bacterium]